MLDKEILPLGIRASGPIGYIEKQKMFSLRCFISFLLILAQCEIFIYLFIYYLYCAFSIRSGKVDDASSLETPKR